MRLTYTVVTVGQVVSQVRVALLSKLGEEVLHLIVDVLRARASAELGGVSLA